MEAFTYCWTDHKTNKLYVGCHKGTTDDGYVASGKAFLQEYNQRPKDFTRQIIAHGTWDDCWKLEQSILRAEKVRSNPNYYNKSYDGFNPGAPKSKEHVEKISLNHAKHWKGKTFSEKTKAKMSTAQKGKTKSEEHKANLSAALKGRTIDWGDKISAAQKGVPKRIVTCPHCNKSGGAPNMKRYHFDRCKHVV